MVGVDGHYLKTLLGLAGSYSSNNVKVTDGVSRINVNSYQVITYGRKDLNTPFYADANFSFARNDYNAARGIAFGDLTRSALSEYSGQQYNAQFGIGYKMRRQDWNIVPHAALRYNMLHLSGYTETNAGGINLNIDTQNYNALIADLAIKLNKPFSIKNKIVTPELRAAYFRDFIADAALTTSNFTGGGADFTIQGLRPFRSTFSVGAGVGIADNKRWSITADYDLELKNYYVAENIALTGKMWF